MPELLKKVLNGDVRGIARAISMIEDQIIKTGTSEAETLMQDIYPHTGKAWVIGVTGSPGAGKSTLTDKLIEQYRAEGKKVGVIAIDPSSPFSGGAILADRIRMQRHTDDPHVYIRSMGTRGSLGGVSNGTREAALILDASGKDVVIIETVGVGQSEVEIMKIADTVCVILVPGLGDDIQIMKAGIMEIADVFVVNKADKEGADKVARETRAMLDLLKDKSWIPPVVLTIAEDGSGLPELVSKIELHKKFMNDTKAGLLRIEKRTNTEVETLLLSRLSGRVEQLWGTYKSDKIKDLLLRKTNPYAVVEEIITNL
ncbi:MAG: methylmalonyl Co-A mutase-associated GTPase MeaB [Synergistaceae bacterium]|nr:methylmalonyl Co-A mutase-associated GTPase MeaB [Synergistaceae bacterium]